MTMRILCLILRPGDNEKLPAARNSPSRSTVGRSSAAAQSVCDAALRARVAPLFGTGGVGLWARDGTLHWQAPIASLNAAESLWRAAQGAELGLVAVTGAVGHRLWQAFEAMAERHPGL
ncbi:MAG: hypothetical protein JNL98_43760, partial [Bryobacterales bacterium]|nr:hypothetical protein [Bryobacterales bacterium]